VGSTPKVGFAELGMGVDGEKHGRGVNGKEHSPPILVGVFLSSDP